jgi:amino acid adenylation domain-containing protein
MPSISIPAQFADAVARFGMHTAVVAPAGHWTYAELDQRSSAIAGGILEGGGADSAVIALLMEHDAPLIAALLGVLKAGKMYHVLDPNHPTETLAAMLAGSGAKMLLTDEVNGRKANSLVTAQLELLEVSETFPRLSPTRILPEVTGEDAAWLMFTSGSSSMPKGVWQNHRGLVAEAQVYAELIGLTTSDRLALLASFGLAASGATLFATLLNGATLCPFHVRSQGAERLADWLRRERITVFHTVPTVFRQLGQTADAKPAFDSLRLVRLGGEPVLHEDVALFRRLCPDNSIFVHSFSSTETGLISTFKIDKQTVLPSQRVPVGHPVRGVQIVLVDEKGQPLKNGGEGKIAIRSPHLRQGYWRQPELTAEKFRCDVGDPKLRTFISNDVGRFLPDGTLAHLGRVDQQVKIRGQRVDLEEIEAALRSVKGVQDAAVLAIDEPSGDKRLVAYLISRDQDAEPSQACRASLRNQLPQHMIPTSFVRLEKLPQTAGGKLDRRALPSPPPPAPSEHMPSHGPKPRDGIERKVARVWESVLGVPSLARSDDVFEVGANSLQATEALVGLEETFGVVLSPADLVEHSTVESLAALIANRAVIYSPRSLVTLRASESGRPLFLVHSGHGDVATYAQLARRLPGRPIYGLQAVGLQGESWPQMSIRAMARRYLPEIVAADPTGPYLLGGTCMGGLVAFELACLLVQQGREVRFLGLMDTTAPPFGGRRSPWTEMLLDPIRDTLRIVRWAVLRALGQGRSGSSLPAYRHFIGSITSRARYYYRPGHYPGTLTMFSTLETPYPRGDRRQLMARYVKTMRTINIPGRREEMFLRPAVDELARQLQACLEGSEVGRD